MEISICKPKPETRARMIELLDKAHSEYAVVYNVYMVNHLSHAFGTLYSLGGTISQIEGFQAHYVPVLEPLKPPKFTVDESNWESYIGNLDAYSELLEFFDKEVARIGAKGCFDRYFPRLLPGVHAAAFHPLIHIGYGLEYDLPQVLTEGLAYAATEYQKSGELIDSLPVTGPPGPSSSLLDIMAELKAGIDLVPQRAKKYDFDILLTQRTEELKKLLLQWRRCELEAEQTSCLNELSKVAVLTFFRSHRPTGKLDFFLAHGLTGNHAVRAIFPHLSRADRTRLLRIFLLAFLGTYWMEDMPEINEDYVYTYEGHPPSTDWNTIVKTALECPEEHVGKIVRAILVIKERVPDSVISHKILDHSAHEIVHLIKKLFDYDLYGVTGQH